jgi:hypothetical protein
VTATENSKKWLRNDEAAAALGVSMQYIKVIAHRESWPTKQPWRQAFYSLESVEKYQKRKAKR